MPYKYLMGSIVIKSGFFDPVIAFVILTFFGFTFWFRKNKRYRLRNNSVPFLVIQMSSYCYNISIFIIACCFGTPVICVIFMGVCIIKRNISIFVKKSV